MTPLTVSVSLDKVIELLQTHRDQHQKDYRKLLAVWLRRMQTLTRELSILLSTPHPGFEKIRKKAKQLNRVEFARPTLELVRYNEVIDMLKAHESDEIELDEEQFKAYVRDEWEWRKDWFANTISYTSSKD